MANTYDVPDLVTLTATYTDADGTADNPTAVIIIAEDGSGTLTGYGTSTGWSDQGNWNAATNTPTLVDGTGTAGHYYTVTAAGSTNFGLGGSITFVVNDRVFYNGYLWRRWPSPSSTTLTNSSTGVYTVNYPVPRAGDNRKVRYRSESVGAGKVAGDENWFNINQVEVP